MAALSVQAVRACRQHLPPAVGIYFVQQRHASSSSNIVRGQTSNLTAYKRGRGGRSSFNGLVVTVFGSSGFLGRNVVNRLGKIGSQLILPYRGDPYFMKDLRLAGDLGQILFQPYNLKDEESIRKCLKYSNVCVNLIGRDFETKNYNYKDVNTIGAERIARIASEMGVERLIHVSHINAQPDPPPRYVKDGSEYLKTKYYGELEAREAFPSVTIMKPSDMYGEGDRFLTYYASRWRRSFGFVPLWKKGTQTVKRPVFVSDVAQGIVNAILDPDTAGQTFECSGPRSYYLSDLIDYIYRCMRYPVRVSYVTPMYKAKVMMSSLFPSRPVLNMDKLDREHVSDIAHEDMLTLEDLGVTLMKLESRANHELKPFRRYRHYEEEIGEFPEPAPPPIVNLA